jgi:hypothetical protein
MAVTYGFYNSVAGDRTYNAEQFSAIFDGIITDGVFEAIGDGLVVTDGSGMNVIVGEGKAWFNHTWTVNDAALTLLLADSDLVLSRIDAVVLEVNASNAVRANTIKVLTGTPASSPVEPTLTNTSEIHQHPLAYIAVGAGVSEILPANITDLIGTYLCPFVTVPQAGTGGGADILEVQVFS